MPSPEHHTYQLRAQTALLRLAQHPDRIREIEQRAATIVVLLGLDLGPARPVLAKGYRGDGRGQDRWDPVVILRCLLLGALIEEPNPNDLVPLLRSSPVLRAIAGVEKPPSGSRRAETPSVGTFYGFMHRLHDGEAHVGTGQGERPSDHERRRATTPRPPWHARPELPDGPRGGPKKKQKSKAKKQRSKPKKGEPDFQDHSAKAALEIVRACQDVGNPDDLTQRLLQILWDCGVRHSAEEGLLGDVARLITSGDGSPLETAASGHGSRQCKCSRRERCTCDRTFSDPDATRAYDSYRKKYYFGHWWYELLVGSEGHALPLGIGLFPGHIHDCHASILVTEQVHKHMRDHAPRWKMAVHIADTGQDSEANHVFLRERGIQPVIPIRKGIPAVHPDRPEISLSERGIPLCQAHVEMHPWGTGGVGKPQFVCPVKAGKLAHCPIAPEGEPDWRCETTTKLGPMVHLNTNKHPRLFPEISRNSATFHRFYALRTASERSNSMKKEPLALRRCHHRRRSFWTIRLYLAALLQHAKVWAGRLGDPRAWLEALLAQAEQAAAA